MFFQTKRSQWNQRRLASRTTSLAILAVTVVACGFTTGCSSISQIGRGLRSSSGFMNDFIVNYRNNAWSAKAWHRRKHRFAKERHMKDFCNGFRAGYEAICEGSDVNGCTPIFPPENYLGWQYQSAEGQSKVSSWFAGYPQGVRAAEEDGVGFWTQIQTNETDRSATPGLNSPGLYPIPDFATGSDLATGNPAEITPNQPLLQNDEATPVFIKLPGVDEPVGELAPGEQLIKIGENDQPNVETK